MSKQLTLAFCHLLLKGFDKYIMHVKLISKVCVSSGSDSLLWFIFLECIYYLIFFHDVLILFFYLSSLSSPTILALIDLSSLALCYRTSVKMVPEPEWGHHKYYWLKSNAWGLDWSFYFFSLFPHILYPPRFPLFQCIAQHYDSYINLIGNLKIKREFRSAFSVHLWNILDLKIFCCWQHEWVSKQEFHNFYFGTWNFTSSSSQTEATTSTFKLAPIPLYYCFHSFSSELFISHVNLYEVGMSVTITGISSVSYLKCLMCHTVDGPEDFMKYGIWG